MSADRSCAGYQMSPTVKPSGKGSVGSSTQDAKPVIQAVPVSSGTTAGRAAVPIPTDRLLEQAPGEGRAQDALVDERLAQGQLSLGVQDGHLGAGAGAARRTVDRARPRGGPVPVQRPGRDGDGVAAR